MYSFCNNVKNNNINNDNNIEEDIIDIIITMPINKAIGPDNMCNKILENTVSTIVKLKWPLNFNPQKTKAVCFSTKKS